jgi:hypothetical protein
VEQPQGVYSRPTLCFACAGPVACTLHQRRIRPRPGPSSTSPDGQVQGEGARARPVSSVTPQRRLREKDLRQRRCGRLCGQAEKRECSHDAAQAGGGIGIGEADDANRAKRPGTLDTPAPASLEASGLLQAVVKREPEEVQGLLAGGRAECGLIRALY